MVPGATSSCPPQRRGSFSGLQLRNYDVRCLVSPPPDPGAWEKISQWIYSSDCSNVERHRSWTPPGFANGNKKNLFFFNCVMFYPGYCFLSFILLLILFVCIVLLFIIILSIAMKMLLFNFKWYQDWLQDWVQCLKHITSTYGWYLSYNTITHYILNIVLRLNYNRPVPEWPWVKTSECR